MDRVYHAESWLSHGGSRVAMAVKCSLTSHATAISRCAEARIQSALGINRPWLSNLSLTRFRIGGSTLFLCICGRSRSLRWDFRHAKVDSLGLRIELFAKVAYK